jgi:hypothetical protein
VGKRLPEDILQILRDFSKAKADIHESYRTKILGSLHQIGIKAFLDIFPYRRSYCELVAELRSSKHPGEQELYLEAMLESDNDRIIAEAHRQALETSTNRKRAAYKAFLDAKAAANEAEDDCDQQTAKQGQRDVKKAEDAYARAKEEETIARQPRQRPDFDAKRAHDKRNACRRIDYQWELFLVDVFEMVRVYLL